MLDCQSRGCGFESHPRQKLKFMSCARCPGLSSPFGKMSTGFRWPGSSTELGLKIHVYVLRWLTVVSDCTGARVENDARPARRKQFTHGHRICLPHPTTHQWLYGPYTSCRVRCKNHLWLLGLEYAKFSLHEKWKNGTHPYRTVKA